MFGQLDNILPIFVGWLYLFLGEATILSKLYINHVLAPNRGPPIFVRVTKVTNTKCLESHVYMHYTFGMYNYTTPNEIMPQNTFNKLECNLI